MNFEEKKKIAKISKKYINNGDVIYISGGTTTLELAKLLYDFEYLVVFTNAINILQELAHHKNIKIKLFGGDFRKKTYSLVGQDTISQMRNYNFKKSFLGANGLSLDKGVTTPNELEAKVDRELAKESKETFLLVDYSKFGIVAYSKICDLEEIDFIITDRKVDKVFMNKFKMNNIELLYK
ncbi:MAG: hypothetical protein K8S14_09560 [Actinomycetia bacterium]|nr:hypothetical protein [Actinomycetes bacterium]